MDARRQFAANVCEILDESAGYEWYPAELYLEAMQRGARAIPCSEAFEAIRCLPNSYPKYRLKGRGIVAESDAKPVARPRLRELWEEVIHAALRAGSFPSRSLLARGLVSRWPGVDQRRCDAAILGLHWVSRGTASLATRTIADKGTFFEFLPGVELQQQGLRLESRAQGEKLVEELKSAEAVGAAWPMVELAPALLREWVLAVVGHLGAKRRGELLTHFDDGAPALPLAPVLEALEWAEDSGDLVERAVGNQTQFWTRSPAFYPTTRAHGWPMEWSEWSTRQNLWSSRHPANIGEPECARMAARVFRAVVGADYFDAPQFFLELPAADREAALHVTNEMVRGGILREVGNVVTLEPGPRAGEVNLSRIEEDILEAIKRALSRAEAERPESVRHCMEDGWRPEGVELVLAGAEDAEPPLTDVDEFVGSLELRGGQAAGQVKVRLKIRNSEPAAFQVDYLTLLSALNRIHPISLTELHRFEVGPP